MTFIYHQKRRWVKKTYVDFDCGFFIILLLVSTRMNLIFILKVLKILNFPVWLRNRLISSGLEPELSPTKKSCMTSNYKQFSTNIRIIYIIRFTPVLLTPRGQNNLSSLQTSVKNLGRAGLDILSYSFSPLFDWLRYRYNKVTGCLSIFW